MNVKSLKDFQEFSANASWQLRSLPEWQRWQGHKDGSNVGVLLHCKTILQQDLMICMNRNC